MNSNGHPQCKCGLVRPKAPGAAPDDARVATIPRRGRRASPSNEQGRADVMGRETAYLGRPAARRHRSGGPAHFASVPLSSALALTISTSLAVSKSGERRVNQPCGGKAEAIYATSSRTTPRISPRMIRLRGDNRLTIIATPDLENLGLATDAPQREVYGVLGI